MEQETHRTLTNDLCELVRVHAAANALLERCGIAPAATYATNLALEEVLSNVIRHGYADAGRRVISVSLRVGDCGVELRVVDDGRAFDPLSAPAVDLDAPLEERAIGGLGLHLLREMASDVRYERADGRNYLYVRI